MVKRIHHPYLVPIMALWLKDEEGNVLGEAAGGGSLSLKGAETELVIAMGLGEKNLADRLKECKAEGKPGIPLEELLGYLEEAAKAIDFLNQPRHDLGEGPVAIQHCDIKPQNIIVVGGSAQVCDFGLARQLNDARKTSMAAGTYAYIAPESIESKSSKTNDQYSLAVSYMELRTGSLPFNANSFYDVMISHLQGKLDYSRLSEPERPVLIRATAKDPEARFPTCLEMVKMLRKAISRRGTSSSSTNLTPVQGTPRPPSLTPPPIPRSNETRPTAHTPAPASSTRAKAAVKVETPPPVHAKEPHSGPVPAWKQSQVTTTKKPGFLARLKAWFFGR
jgi:serine/threonine-protein kinase